MPNPSKVIIILEELRIPYEGVYIDTPDLKKPEYEAVNPNGRVPGLFLLKSTVSRHTETDICSIT